MEGKGCIQNAVSSSSTVFELLKPKAFSSPPLQLDWMRLITPEISLITRPRSNFEHGRKFETHEFGCSLHKLVLFYLGFADPLIRRSADPPILRPALSTPPTIHRARILLAPLSPLFQWIRFSSSSLLPTAPFDLLQATLCTFAKRQRRCSRLANALLLIRFCG